MNSNLPILIELHYFPSLQYFSKFFLHPSLILERHENYVKRSFRNRAHIASANGLLRLSVPLEKGKNQQQSIRKVRISYDEPWQNKQWTAICSAYGNAPFFEYYVDDFRPLFEERTEFLFDHNLKVLQALFFILDMQPNMEFSDTYQTETTTTIIDFRNRITPKTIASPFDLTYQNRPYQQVFSEKTGYLPNLSILDLIFCKGPETLPVLEDSVLHK